MNPTAFFGFPTVQAILEHYGLLDGSEPVSGKNIKVLCPFHNSSTPNCSVNLDSGLFKCFAASCEQVGDLVKLIAGKLNVSRSELIQEIGKKTTARKRNPVSENLVDLLRKKLELREDLRKTLKNKKNISEDTLLRRKIGYDVQRERYSIPIYDGSRTCINIRFASLTDKINKVTSLEDKGSPYLYPIESMVEKEIIVTEGEWKALLLCQHGFSAVTAGGVRSWNQELNNFFVGKAVYIIFDVDEAGCIGAQKLARELVKYAESVRVCSLLHYKGPDPEVDIWFDRDQNKRTGGIDDFFIRFGGTPDAIRQVMNSGDLWSEKNVFLDRKIIDDPTIHEVPLYRTADKEFYQKFISTEALASAKGRSPYLVPRTYAIRCRKDQQICDVCPLLKNSSKEPEIQINEKDPVLLEMIDVPKSSVDRVLRAAAGIPTLCSASIPIVRDSWNLEDVLLIPQIRVSTRNEENVIRRSLCVGTGIQTNTSYRVEGRVTPDPKSQHAVLLVYKSEPTLDTLAQYEIKEESVEIFNRIIRPKDWTADSIEESLNRRYEDLEANVTKIFKRRDLHLMYDLTYHSPLYMTFRGESVKCWMESLVVGDSGQGKSKCVEGLLNHYGLGEKYDSKGASIAGLKGGLQQTDKKWYVTWGQIPINDRRLVVLEEVKGMSVEIISQCTDMRSSGIASLTKIDKQKTQARTRLIWISNPRTDGRQISSYNFGVEAVQELIGGLEDIRRFDVAMVVASGEVEEKFINIPMKDMPKVDSIFTSDICRSLILWTWSRETSQVRFEEEAEGEILRLASEMSKKFSSAIPLVEPADQRNKIARIASAFAALTFSTPDEDPSTILVRKCHVEATGRFLNRIYSSKSLGYEDYSMGMTASEVLVRPDDIKKSIREKNFSRELVVSLLESNTFQAQDIADWTGDQVDEARGFLGVLMRQNAVRRVGRNYVKTSAFILLLKEMRVEPPPTKRALETLDKGEF
jgi:hypothetical protein